MLKSSSRIFASFFLCENIILYTINLIVMNCSFFRYRVQDVTIRLVWFSIPEKICNLYFWVDYHRIPKTFIEPHQCEVQDQLDIHFLTYADLTNIFQDESVFLHSSFSKTLRYHYLINLFSPNCKFLRTSKSLQSHLCSNWHNSV